MLIDNKMRSQFLNIMILALIASANAFTINDQRSKKIRRPPTTFSRTSTASELQLMEPSTAVAVISTIRGGCQSKILQTLASSLSSGPFGILSLFAYALVVNLPLTLYRQAYSFSVGYGLSVFAMAVSCFAIFRPPVPTCIAELYLMNSANPSFLLVSAAAFYGLRLGLFLLFRELTVPSKAKALREMDKTPRLKRVILSASVSLFYALMTGPIMYALRSPAAVGNKVAFGGAALAWFGVKLEALTDLQKWLFNRGVSGNEEEGGKKVFAGPTGWAFSVVRHPNYLGEVLFWTGIFVGGTPSYGRNYIAWIGSVLGISGVWALMLGATKRLEAKQSEAYKGQEKYDNWTQKSKYPLIPFMG